MSDGDMQFGGSEGRRHGGIGVAIDNGYVRPVLQQDRLEPLHDLSGLRAMAAASDAEIVARRRYL